VGRVREASERDDDRAADHVRDEADQDERGEHAAEQPIVGRGHRTVDLGLRGEKREGRALAPLRSRRERAEATATDPHGAGSAPSARALWPAPESSSLYAASTARRPASSRTSTPRVSLFHATACRPQAAAPRGSSETSRKYATSLSLKLIWLEI